MQTKPVNRDDLLALLEAARWATRSLDEACGIREFVAPTSPYYVALHTGYLSRNP
jgi:hypothetical protein